MNLKALFNRFRTEEDGAVTVDWVVLTAGLVVLVGLIGGLVAQGVQSAGNNIRDELTAPSAFTVDGGGGGGGEEPADPPT